MELHNPIQIGELSMITNAYLNLLRNWIASGSGTIAIASGGMGINFSDVSLTDTGLNGNANLGTANLFKAVTAASSLFVNDKAITWEYKQDPSTTATGSSFSEFGLDTGAVLFNRKIYEPIQKKRYTSFTFVTNLILR